MLDSTFIFGEKVMKSIARAHTNIALIKYWGKKNDELIIPYNNSLSLTLDQFYTDTMVVFDEELSEDQISFNNHPASKTDQVKIGHFLDLVRKRAKTTNHARVETMNHVPTAAGLASSASGYAALAAAASKAAGLDLNQRDLSRLARRGSGSATRSIYGGFVEWVAGTDDENSYAVPYLENVDFDISIVALMVNKNKKKINSRDAMSLSVKTSPYYPSWVNTADIELKQIKHAIDSKSIDEIGKIAEHNALCMHSTTISAQPSFSYFEPETIEAIQRIKSLRDQGLSCYFTMDAGPNLKIIVPQNQEAQLVHELHKYYDDSKILACKPGPGIEFLE